MRKDIHFSFLSAPSVAIAWIGGLTGPIYVYIGIEDSFSVPFYIGAFLIFIVAATIREVLKSEKRKVKSDIIVYCVVPICCFVIGFTIVLFAAAVNIQSERKNIAISSMMDAAYATPINKKLQFQ